MSAENKSLARRAMDELWAKGNLAAVDQLYSENCVFHDLGNPEDIRGREGLKQYARLYRTACPDLQCTLEEIVAEGDKVALRWDSRGTHQGDLMGIGPTGKQVTFRGIQMQRGRELHRNRRAMAATDRPSPTAAPAPGGPALGGTSASRHQSPRTSLQRRWDRAALFRACWRPALFSLPR